MKRFIIITACVTLLLPLRIVVSLSSRARANASEITSQVADVVNRGLSKAQLNLKANARVAADTLKTGLGSCVENGVNNVKTLARKMAPETAGKNGKSRGSIPLRTYIDLSILVAIVALFKRRRQEHC